MRVIRVEIGIDGMRSMSGIVDASVVCWGSERGMAGGGAYCLEAGYLFGEGRERDLP